MGLVIEPESVTVSGSVAENVVESAGWILCDGTGVTLSELQSEGRIVGVTVEDMTL